MIEIILAFLVGVGVGFSGYFWLPPRQETQNIEQRQEQRTDVWQVQATIVIVGTNGMTNININLKGITNISFNTNYTITNKK